LRKLTAVFGANYLGLTGIRKVPWLRLNIDRTADWERKRKSRRLSETSAAAG